MAHAQSSSHYRLIFHDSIVRRAPMGREVEVESAFRHFERPTWRAPVAQLVHNVLKAADRTGTPIDACYRQCVAALKKCWDGFESFPLQPRFRFASRDRIGTLGECLGMVPL
jgi:hypothetical protein